MLLAIVEQLTVSTKNITTNFRLKNINIYIFYDRQKNNNFRFLTHVSKISILTDVWRNNIYYISTIFFYRRWKFLIRGQAAKEKHSRKWGMIKKIILVANKNFFNTRTTANKYKQKNSTKLLIQLYVYLNRFLVFWFRSYVPTVKSEAFVEFPLGNKLALIGKLRDVTP